MTARQNYEGALMLRNQILPALDECEWGWDGDSYRLRLEFKFPQPVTQSEVGSIRCKAIGNVLANAVLDHEAAILDTFRGRLAVLVEELRETAVREATEFIGWTAKQSGPE